MNRTARRARDGRRTLAWSALVLTTIAGCAHEQPDRSRPDWLTASVAERVEGAVGETPDDLLARLGTPLSTEMEPVENRHVAGQIDTLATYRYEGLEITYYLVSADGRVLVSDLVVSDAGYLGELSFDIGSTAEEIEEALGEPQARSSGEMRYEDEYTTLVLDMRGGVLIRLRLIPYLD